MDFYELMPILLNREIGHFPRNSLEVVDHGTHIVKTSDEEFLFALDDMTASVFHLPHCVVDIPWMFQLLFTPQQLMQRRIGLIAYLLCDKHLFWLEDTQHFRWVVAPMTVDDKIERLIWKGQTLIVSCVNGDAKRSEPLSCWQ